MKKLTVLFSLSLFSTALFGVCTTDALRTIDQKAQLNGSWIGNPTTNPFALPVGKGCARHYQAGSVYYHPCIGGVEIHGLIRQLWSEQGWERGALGFPTTDELKMTDGVGRVSFFQGGAVYYHPRFGTYRLTPEFHRLWRDKGGIGGLGYPTAAMKCHTGADICTQSFERGVLTQKIGEVAQSVDLRPEIARRQIGIRNQENRLTCSVHTTTFLLEYAYSQVCGPYAYTDLSEEYLNHATNLTAKNEDDGDFFHNIIAGYNQYGMVKETVFPFKSTYQFKDTTLSIASVASGIQLLNAKKLNLQLLKPITTPMGLSTEEFNRIIAALNRGVPVGLGRSHSMPIVGYRLDVSQPGGGVFIFRNSYGLTTGTNGYQEEDFASVKSTASDAILVEPELF